jgi:hypothetical protein
MEELLAAGIVIAYFILCVIFIFSVNPFVKSKVGTPSASHNSERESVSQILLNCASCRWRDHCVCKINGNVCRSKYERKTSPIS